MNRLHRILATAILVAGILGSATGVSEAGPSRNDGDDMCPKGSVHLRSFSTREPRFRLYEWVDYRGEFIGMVPSALGFPLYYPACAPLDDTMLINSFAQRRASMDPDESNPRPAWALKRTGKAGSLRLKHFYRIDLSRSRLLKESALRKRGGVLYLDGNDADWSKGGGPKDHWKFIENAEPTPYPPKKEEEKKKVICRKGEIPVSTGTQKYRWMGGGANAGMFPYGGEYKADECVKSKDDVIMRDDFIEKPYAGGGYWWRLSASPLGGAKDMTFYRIETPTDLPKGTGRYNFYVRKDQVYFGKRGGGPQDEWRTTQLS
ncbi:hypothetical protein ACFWZ2_38525 [Streptomyces sp. NPDC059002]|uniref:hypothetical protein n=1 Tax=Streptomyces sp. NPDC059002 TaxID=3346690 RepID=UPI0036C365F1